MISLTKLSVYGPFLVMVAATLWAVDGVLRRSLFSLPPVTIVFYEHLIGLLLLLPVLVNNWAVVKSLTKRELLNLMWIALFSGLLGTLWFTTALLKVNFISFSVVFLLQKLQPVFVIIAAAIILKERITQSYIKWGALALVAAYFVTFPNGIVNFATGIGTIEAALYAVAAAFAWGTSTIFSKIVLQTKPDQVVTATRFLLTTGWALLAVVLMGQTSSLALITPPQIGLLFLITLSTGMVALSIYYKGLANTEAKIATMLELVFPVTAVLIDAIFYKSLLAPSQYIAAGVLLFAVGRLSFLRADRVSFESTKVTGKGRGKKLGFPTINLEIPDDLSMREGIYAAYVTLNNKTYHSAVHYGPVPTFKDPKASLELYLLNVDDLPNDQVKHKKIKVEVVQFLRPIMRFSSPAALIAQIELDVKRVKAIL